MMDIVKLPINEIELSEYNPRKDLRPGDPEYEKLYNSIEEFGYVSPIIVNKNNNVIIGGHQRYKVLRELGYKEIDCILVDLDEQREKALNIALNKIEGEWDMDKLSELFADFQAEGFDVSLTGFDKSEIDDLIGDFDPLEEEEATASPVDNEEVVMVECPSCKYVGEKEEFTNN